MDLIRQTCGPTQYFCAHKGTNMAELDDTRRDLQLMIVTWGRLKVEIDPNYLEVNKRRA
jgi:hypothetical protein